MLADAVVAGRHARITIEHGEAAVEDLGSAEGTYVNELQVIGRAKIRPGDRIRFGMTVVELVTAEQARADRGRSKQPAVPQLASAVLEHVPEHELAPGRGPRSAGPLRTEETSPAFVSSESDPAPRPQDRFGALAAWTDSRVKHQTGDAGCGGARRSTRLLSLARPTCCRRARARSRSRPRARSRTRSAWRHRSSPVTCADGEDQRVAARTRRRERPRPRPTC